MPTPFALLTAPIPVRLPDLLRVAIAFLLRLIAPPRCPACDASTSPRSTFCPTCELTLQLETPCDSAHPGIPTAPAAPARSASTHLDDAPVASIESDPVCRALPDFAYGLDAGALAKAIRRFKYGARPDLSGPLAEALRGVIERARIQADLVIPVPLHPRKLRERGYNQTALLAAEIACSARARFAPRALLRVRDTTPQASLDRASRAANIAGAFRARDPAQIQGKHILLLDDVTTTGATLRACLTALSAAGAARVTTLVLALRPREQVHPREPA